MPKYDLWGHSNLDIDISKEVFPNEEWLKDHDELFDHPYHGFFESSYQKKKLHYRRNLPKKEGVKVKAIVVWHHGILGQSGFGMRCSEGAGKDNGGYRYTDMALRIRKMNEQGIAVYSHDALGHGFSEGRRFYIPDGKYKINVDDLMTFCHMAAKDHPPETPLFLSGDSYGGCLALHASYQFQTHPENSPKGFVGCLLNCPSIEADLPPPPVVWFLRYGLAPFFPTWTPFFMPHPITAERTFKLEEPRAYFTDPKKMHDLSRGGTPLCLGTAVGCLVALIEAQKLSHNFNLPFHINHGSDDYAVPISGSQHLMKHSKTPTELKVLNVVEGGYHALFSELDADDTVNHEITWIQQMIKRIEGN